MAWPLYCAIDQSDSASLVTIDGVQLICEVHLNRADNRIEAVCYTKQPEHGTLVEVFRNFVYRGDTDEQLDSPKILAVGGFFVVHWLVGDAAQGIT